MGKVTRRGNGVTSVQSRFARVNGIRLHYLTAGAGEPVVLLHGYAQNSHMWRPLIAELAKIPHRHCARPAWIWPIRQTAARL